MAVRPAPHPRRHRSPRPTGETELQRWQRNFTELLQELRVAQAGVQILFAFLLLLAFSPGFEPSGVAQAVYLAALLSSAGAAALLTAPVAYHRVLFRRNLKPDLVRTAHRFAYAGLMLLIASVTSGVYLATDAVLGRPQAAMASAGAAAWFLLFWGALPWLRRWRAAAANR